MSANYPDIISVGLTTRLPVRVAASATRAYVGEPVKVAPTYTSGVSSVNTVVQCADGDGVIATDQFAGILAKDMEVNGSGTVLAHRSVVDLPFAQHTRLRGAAKTASTCDTESEAIGLLNDICHFDLTSSVFTIEPAGADTKWLTVRWYRVASSQLDVVVDQRALDRVDVS